MRLLVSGYRYFSDPQVITEEVLREVNTSLVEARSLLSLSETKDENQGKETITVIHGDCPTGVDATIKKLVLEGTLAKQSNYHWVQVPFPANWLKYKRGGGPIRNRQMILEGKPDCAIIFLSPKSTGTLNMKNLLDEYRIKYTEVQLAGDSFGMYE